MQQLANLLSNYVSTNIIPIVVTVVGLVFMIIGFAFMAGRKGREWGKEQTLWTLLGCALIYTATSIAMEIASGFGF